jgi:hypothetical protein
LLNADNVTQAVFQLEIKLRYLVKDDNTKCKIMAIYDCCRVELSSMSGLSAGRGGGVDISEDEIEGEPPCRYFHI